MGLASLTSHGTDGEIDGAVYRQILKKSFIPCAKRLFKERKCTLKHTANLTREMV